MCFGTIENEPLVYVAWRTMFWPMLEAILDVEIFVDELTVFSKSYYHIYLTSKHISRGKFWICVIIVKSMLSSGMTCWASMQTTDAGSTIHGHYTWPLAKRKHAFYERFHEWFPSEACNDTLGASYLVRSMAMLWGPSTVWWQDAGLAQDRVVLWWHGHSL